MAASSAEAPRAAKARGASMTIGGTVGKTLFLLALCAATAVFAWSRLVPYDAEAGVYLAQFKSSPMPYLFGGLIAGMVFGLWTALKPAHAPVTAPLYALSEGFFLGAISSYYAVAFAKGDDGQPAANAGMIMQAMLGTFGVLGVMGALYGLRIIKPTQKLMAGVVAATGGIALVYLVSIVASMFGGRIPFIHESGPIGIGFSVVVIGIAALNFVLDFNYIEQGVANKAPRSAEWYGGFALMTTLVWLYIEILHLLAKLQSRD
jgi:uncharacterized YccA/Bax inhibitor family protein